MSKKAWVKLRKQSLAAEEKAREVKMAAMPKPGWIRAIVWWFSPARKARDVAQYRAHVERTLASTRRELERKAYRAGVHKAGVK